MKVIIEPSVKEKLFLNIVDGVILPLMDYSVESTVSFSIDEIEKICKSTKKEVFVKINKNLLNDDIDTISNILKKLDDMSIKGVFFYDIAILELKRELGLQLDLVWNQTHMVHNYRTCDYYHSKGVKYALLGKELTLEEIIEIIEKSSITSMVEVVSKPSVAFSRRKLLTNYGKHMGIDVSSSLVVEEKVNHDSFYFLEDQNGTSIFLDKITNGTSVIQELYNHHCSYIIMREFGIDCFEELVTDTMTYIENECVDYGYVEKYKKLGDSTNFFFRKTIYKVKK